MKKRLKIIIFDGSFRTTPFINRLIIGLAKKHTVYVFGFNETISNKLKNVKYVSLGSNQNRLRFIRTALGFSFKKNGSSSFIQTVKLLFHKQRKKIQQQNFETAIKEINPDILHVQWPSLLEWCEPFMKKNECSIILSQRGSQTNISPFINPSFLSYLKKIYPKIAGFHSVSKAISEKGDVIWCENSKVNKVVYTGLPIKKICFSKENFSLKKLSLLSVGRSHWIKGYTYALKCCKLLKEEGIDFNYTIIGGAGDEELLYLRKDYNLENEVIIKDRIPQDQVYKLMKNSSLMLVSSIEEGIANVAVEAMALGLPVLSSDCGGMTELITHDSEGWVVPMRNPEAMAEAIINVINMPLEKINNIQLSARKKVEEQYSEKQMITGMEQLYYEAIDKQLNKLIELV